VGFSQRERQLLFKLLQEGVARGEVRDVNLPLLAAGLQAALLEVSEHVLREKGLDLDSLTELMVDVIFHGIGGAPCGKS
jgi:NTP pyrophosphatase (non-canonical NTP hydrolase)